LRALVQGLNRKGVRVEFVKESLVFTGEDSPLANLMLSVRCAFAEFELSLIRERQRGGIALAKQRGAYKGRKKTATAAGPRLKQKTVPCRSARSLGREAASNRNMRPEIQAALPAPVR